MNFEIDCNVDLDSEEEIKQQEGLRKNISEKQQRESTMHTKYKFHTLDATPEEDPPSPEMAEPEPAQVNKGIDQLQIVSHGLKFIVINDKDNNFLPVLSTNFSHFNVQWDYNSRQSCLWTDLNSSMNFFNVNIGVWEPFIERFGVKLMINHELSANRQNTELKFSTPLCINFTEKLIENLYQSSNSWSAVSEKFESYMQSYKNDCFTGDLGVSDFDLDVAQKIGESLPQNKKRLRSPRRLFKDEDIDEQEEDNQLLERPQSMQVKKGSILGKESVNADPKFNEEIITPYVIVNKIDMPIIVKRLGKKDQKEENEEKIKKYKKLIQDKEFQEANILKRRSLTTQYRLEEGQIIDYMVDYNETKFKLGGSTVFASDQGRVSHAFDPEGDLCLKNDQTSNIHSDSIGEYKSEYIRVYFDSANLQGHAVKNFKENKEISKIDLNELGYRSHTLRDGQFMEKIFYGVLLIDFKKVFRIRTQFQLVNRTEYDYLIHFRFKDFSILKFIESGDSLALPMRLDDSKV